MSYYFFMARPTEEDVERALQIAVKAHAGQKDKYGAPLIFHPLRMMMGQTDPREKITALLHDVVEKSGWTLADLEKQGFSKDIIKTIGLLTRNKKETYADYLLRVKKDPLAIKIKMADLEDHMDLTRAATLTPDILEKLKKSLISWTSLKNHQISRSENPDFGKKISSHVSDRVLDKE